MVKEVQPSKTNHQRLVPNLGVILCYPSRRQPNHWTMDFGSRHSKLFSFSFGGEPGSFDVVDIISNFFRTSENMLGKQHEGFNWPRSNLNYPTFRIIQNIDSQSFKEKVRDRGITWLMLFYVPSTMGYDVHELLIEDVLLH